MSTETIPRPKWRDFLTSFTVAHQGWLVTVDRVSPTGVRQTVFRDLPLLSILDDKGRVVIGTASDSASSNQVIEDPALMRVDRTAQGADRMLEIETGDGGLVRLHFRSTIPPELVDGVPG